MVFEHKSLRKEDKDPLIPKSAPIVMIDKDVPSCSSTGCKQVTLTYNSEIGYTAKGFCLSIVQQGINKCISNATVIKCTTMSIKEYKIIMKS